MASEREERLALNETIFRSANERMKEWEERHENERAEIYHCECALTECSKRVELSAAQYEAVRANPRHFVVAKGHAIPDVETVVDHGDGYDVVEKPEAVDHITKPTDPRGAGGGPAGGAPRSP